MMGGSPYPRPPRLAAWLVELFTSADQAECILGDLAEEFSDLASRSGVVSVRRWYWRQSAKTIAHLGGAAFRIAPWSIIGAVLLGLALRRFSFTLPERIIVAALRMQRPYSNLHYGFYVWQVTYGIPIAHAIMSMFVGCLIALFAKRREMVATLTLALVLCALIGAALMRVASLGPIDVAWLRWSFADPCATILGGVIVLEFRLLLAHRHLPT
ncbi:MAG TPA: permease prefix domain 2-containing transporter [Candidatus Angelobacter sp.]|nr:permease prefix domain 2-containing transporter [Candidatus Angelobacter sp.]